MINEGLVLMAAGMGTVFFFLTTMVMVMYAAAGFFKSYFPAQAPAAPEPARFVAEPAPAPAPVAPVLEAQPRPATSDATTADDNVEIAVAIAAVKAHLLK